MDYFQGVVSEYLRADRAMFVNPECLIQLDPHAPFLKGRHWYCDVLAVSFRESAVYLCEVSYSSTLHSLVQRLLAWNEQWSGILAALVRDSLVPKSWDVRPWLFIPADREAILKRKLASLQNNARSMPEPKVTHLEFVAPWRFCTYDRKPQKMEGEIDA